MSLPYSKTKKQSRKKCSFDKNNVRSRVCRNVYPVPFFISLFKNTINIIISGMFKKTQNGTFDDAIAVYNVKCTEKVRKGSLYKK